jgi:uncharacterized protein (DUF952 family)
MTDELIMHIANQEDWAAAQIAGTYRAASLESEGFLHCSTAAQVVAVANAFFAAQTGLLLLTIDPARVQAPLRYEAPAPPDGSTPAALADESRFPHLYGPLNLDAVVRVVPFVPDAQGRFWLPE